MMNSFERYIVKCYLDFHDRNCIANGVKLMKFLPNVNEKNIIKYYGKMYKASNYSDISTAIMMMHVSNMVSTINDSTPYDIVKLRSIRAMYINESFIENVNDVCIMGDINPFKLNWLKIDASICDIPLMDELKRIDIKKLIIFTKSMNDINKFPKWLDDLDITSIHIAGDYKKAYMNENSSKIKELGKRGVQLIF